MPPKPRAASPPAKGGKPTTPASRGGSPPRGKSREAKTPAAAAADEPLPPPPEPEPPAPEPEPEPEPEPVEEGPEGPDALPLTLPAATAAATIPHESYWRRRSEARDAPRWAACDPAAHGGSWKALFFERRTAELLCGEGEAAGEPLDGEALRWELAAAAPYVRSLALRPKAPGAIDYGLLCEVLSSSLTSLKLSFDTAAVGTGFEPAARPGAPAAELAALGAALRRCEALTALDLSANAVSDAAGAALAAALAGSRTLTRLDLSYNELSDAAAAALAALARPPSVLTHLLLARNAIGAPGAASLAAALRAPDCTLLELELRLNQLGDEGGAELLLALGDAPPGGGLARLGLAATGLGARSAAALGAVLRAGGAAGADVDLSTNALGADGGAKLAAGVAAAAAHLGALRLHGCAGIKEADVATLAAAARAPGAPPSQRVGTLLLHDRLRPPQQAPLGAIR